MKFGYVFSVCGYSATLVILSTFIFAWFTQPPNMYDQLLENWNKGPIIDIIAT